MKDNLIYDSELLTEEPVEAATTEEELKFRRPKKLFKKKKTLVILFIVLGLIVMGLAAVAGYMIFKPDKVYDDSAAFYFASDLLSEEGGRFTACDTIDFNVYNYADSLRVSKEPVESFSVAVKVDGKDITGKSEITMGESAMEPGVRSGCAVSVSVPEKYMDSVIDVMVTSSPIPKELKASFVLESAWGYDLKDEKGNVCAELVVYANKDVSIEFGWDDGKLIPDSTDSYIRTADNGETKCNIELSAGMSATIPLFKVDPSKQYDKDNKAISLKAVKYTVDETEDTTQTVSETEEVSE